MACQHVFADPRRSCGHETPGGAERCLWHNPAVAKADPYVKALFLHAEGLHASFSEAHLAGIDLKDLALGERDFANADLRDAMLDGCDLAKAVLAGANLRRASFRHADLRGADLRGANLIGTSFSGADLRDADLSGAVLDGTVLLGADLRGANLEGAQVAGFQWNRLTRFHGVRGLDAKSEPSDGDTTQIFLAPVAMEDLDTPDRLAFDRDPELARTRVFSIGRSASAEFPPPELAGVVDAPAVARPGLRWPWLLVPAFAGLLIGAASIALVRPAVPPTPEAQELESLRAQREADGQQIRTLQDQATGLADQLATLQQGTGADSARAELLRQQLGEAQADLARLLDADDRATALQTQASEQEILARDLAGVTARQERMSRILADGVERYRSDSERLTGELAEARSRVASLEATQAENVRLKQRVTALGGERDSLAVQYKAASGELAAAKKDIERYLARISGSQLAGLLTEEGSGAPLVPIVPGKPVSMGGDYLVTLAVSPGKTQPASIELQLVIQRPVASANPDATIVLYDERKRPLRRVAASFPHVDQGAPFVSVGANVSCDRMPAFARVVLAPGIDEVAAR